MASHLAAVPKSYAGFGQFALHADEVAPRFAFAKQFRGLFIKLREFGSYSLQLFVAAVYPSAHEVAPQIALATRTLVAHHAQYLVEGAQRREQELHKAIVHEFVFPIIFVVFVGRSPLHVGVGIMMDFVHSHFLGFAEGFGVLDAPPQGV